MYPLCSRPVFTTAWCTLWGIVFLLTSSQAMAQYQSTSISYLTALPLRDDGRNASNTQDPKQPQSIDAAGLTILPPFAWNRTDTYVPHDFNNFFPDDPEGGKQLDALFSRKLGGGHTPSDIFAAVRRGLRTTLTMIARHRTEFLGDFNVLRLFAEILLNEPTDHYLSKATIGSIQWSLRDKAEQQVVATYLDKALQEHERYSPAVLMRLSNIVSDWLGRKPATYAAFKDRGNFFLLFRHRDHPQLSSLTSFTNKSFANEAYWVETIGVEAEQAVSMFLVIRSLEGLESDLAKLSATEGVMIDFGGPMSELKSAEKLPPQLQKYIAP